MSDAAPTLDTLLVSYRRTIMARIQQREFVGWGTTLEEGFRQTIALHMALEESFITSEIQRRAEQDKAAKQ